jgi:hypothetical protein
MAMGSGVGLWTALQKTQRYPEKSAIVQKHGFA